VPFLLPSQQRQSTEIGLQQDINVKHSVLVFEHLMLFSANCWQVSQLLKPDGGRFISITFAQPHFRVPLYIADPVYNWSIDVNTFGTGFHYFYYTMTRGLEPSHDALQRRHNYEQRRMLCRDVTPVSNSDTEDFSFAAFNVDTG